MPSRTALALVHDGLLFEFLNLECSARRSERSNCEVRAPVWEKERFDLHVISDEWLPVRNVSGAINPTAR